VKVVVLAADLSDEHEAERLLAKVSEQAGAVAVLVNNAGVGDSVLFDCAKWERTRQIVQTNIFAVAQLTSALVPGMVERRRGGVLNIGSGAGLTVLPNAAAYVGSKHFVAGFSEALRADLSGTGVTVTQVCPGPVESESIKCPALREAWPERPRNSSGSLPPSVREKRWPDSSAERPESFQAGPIDLS